MVGCKLSHKERPKKDALIDKHTHVTQSQLITGPHSAATESRRDVVKLAVVVC